MRRMIFCSNNPEYQTLSCQEPEVRALPGAAQKVLTFAREAVHTCWRLLNHPLHGNVQPGQQPCRTLLRCAPMEPGNHLGAFTE